MAQILARDLGREGFVVVSGLARGIDAAAHEAALEAGTVAVFAGGLDRPYPPENRPLCRSHPRIAAARMSRRCRWAGSRGQGIFHAATGWSPACRRGVVVVEAAERSGSLITARLAGTKGGIVFAVPGSPLDPRATGSNRLIKEGSPPRHRDRRHHADAGADAGSQFLAAAGLVRAGADTGFASQPLPGEGDRALLLEAMGPVPTVIDDLIRYTGLSASAVQVLLIELDLAGRIERHPGQRVALIEP